MKQRNHCSTYEPHCNHDGFFVDDSCYSIGIQPNGCIVVCGCGTLMRTDDPADVEWQRYECPDCGASVMI